MDGHAVLGWLLDGDPAIRWQVMRDLQDAPEVQWRPERHRVEHEGWGARLLAHEDPDGMWAAGACFPGDFTGALFEAEGQPWTATMNVLADLRALGLEPSSERARRAVRLIGEHGRWEYDGMPYWGGEVEECINGRTVADGAYLGVDMSALVARLVGERQPDGGWNCERANGSTRSSFHSTIDVLEGLLEFERVTGGTSEARAARESGEEYLLERHLFRRLSTGEPADPEFLQLGFPWRWHYSMLRGLDHLRRAAELTGARPDPRAGEAIEHLRSRRGSDGRWQQEWQPRGRVWFEMEPVGMPSRWVTLIAMRVLRWWDARMTRQTIYEAAGGAEGMLRLAHAWHIRALADPVVEHAFSHGFRPDHSERLAAYLGEALGGPPDYSTTLSSESEVIRLHSGNGVHDEMDRHAIEAFARALDDVGLTDPRLRQALLDYWVDGVRRMGEHPDTPDTVPHGLAVRRWSWDGPVD